MRSRKFLINTLIGVAGVLFVGAQFVPGADKTGPIMTAAQAIVSGRVDSAAGSVVATSAGPDKGGVGAEVKVAVAAFSSVVGPLSRPEALDDAFRSYFAFKAAHPADVKKPYLYFVDYGQPGTAKRGYLFDMSSLTLVEGPFTVAHGKGSSSTKYGVPTHFSNASGSNSTSLGLYVTGSTYAFHGHSGGHPYSSIGLVLNGVSKGFNDNAARRRVVAHGAPYVTPTRAGRSEGCPAMEPDRAKRLLPKLADGSMVFLFAPNSQWLAGDPWLAATNG
ncbi:MAG TPA: murein L,D-transpeptidase catalytic domain family protein [Gemmatimonadaceae bacterium]|nr:murein L,D-transpeptidase catalytic domain family protein [Gemmatimonadaceae bacterium]